MMIVPQYWAEARLQHRAHRRQITVRRFGWSDESQDAAQAHADARTREALDRLMAGEALPRREHKVAYNGAEGLPIREEVVERHGEDVVTRNSYGALCLNTPDVLFADVDFDILPQDPRLRRWLRRVLLVLAVALGAYARSLSWGVLAALVAVVAAWLIARGVHRFDVWRKGGPEAMARRRVERFMQAHPEGRWRCYRTPAGLRLLALHRVFDPSSADVAACFKALGVDGIYALMSQRQHCFRARVSAKPWRIGVSVRMRPRPGVWPISPERMPDRRRWIADYERAARGYAACRLEREYGTGPIDARAAEVRRLHDALSGVERGLPIA